MKMIELKNKDCISSACIAVVTDVKTQTTEINGDSYFDIITTYGTTIRQEYQRLTAMIEREKIINAFNKN